MTEPLSSKDKTDIVMALRWIASAIENDEGDPIPMMGTIGAELIVLATKYAPKPIADDMSPDAVEIVARREIGAIADTVWRFLSHQITEHQILNERLMRMFDPGMAWNEAINRAIEAKKKAREEIILFTPTQKFMFETLQVPNTMKALEKA